MHGSKPSSRRIADLLTEAISSGHYRVGERLPTEHQLASIYGVGRHTISLALDQVGKLGMIRRRPRLGTRVISKFPVGTMVESGETLQDWTQYGRDFYLDISSVGEGMPPAAHVGEPGRVAWLRAEGLRRSPDGGIIGHSVIYVHPDFAQVRANITSRPPAVFTLIEERYGPVIRRVRHELKAVPIEGEVAERLGVAEGTPGLRTTRFYLGAHNSIVELVVNTHPAERFTYSIEVRRAFPTAT